MSELDKEDRIAKYIKELLNKTNQLEKLLASFTRKKKIPENKKVCIGIKIKI